MARSRRWEIRLDWEGIVIIAVCAHFGVRISSVPVYDHFLPFFLSLVYAIYKTCLNIKIEYTDTETGI